MAPHYQFVGLCFPSSLLQAKFQTHILLAQDQENMNSVVVSRMVVHLLQLCLNILFSIITLRLS